ncbi:hypothetical protein KC19_3G215400 [Ceratodon purpureus]|uniref:Uncharacterized protein n=1 Tax=Ceratodon purpureus TaxID=3225 RepID=A0A8T0INW0_CERPU|nr:hypothetical protein KC19_3G215400 [Ceratodon purpureus]
MENIASSSDSVNKRQEERSLWREKVEHRLRIAKERLHCETNSFQILKVPEYNRQPPEMYTPQGWRFGLHNLDSVDKDSAPEAMKLCVPLLFGLDEAQKWENFCDYVVPDHTRMLGFYGLHKEDINLKEEEIKQLLAFDALFIVWAIDLYEQCLSTNEHIICPKNQVPDALLSKFILWSSIFRHDLWAVENQIPFELIARAIEYINREKRLETPVFPFELLNKRNVSLLEMWMKRAVQRSRYVFDMGDDMYAQEMSDLRLSESHHILDAAYKVICGKEGLERERDESQMGIIHIPSAIQLKHAGVKIEGVGKPLCTMSYNKTSKSLILPKMKIYDDTFAFIRNMARYALLDVKASSMYLDYISIMLDLIKTPDDMDYLIKCGVIHNECGSRTFEMWQPLDKGLLLLPYSTREVNAMKDDINRRYDQKLPKLSREFRTLFCSRPWLVVPVIAATLVTIATLIQTYTAVIGSDRMMPQYKNP